MKRIIIDCDPGHDDAVAIMLAYFYEEELDLAAITTVCGNNTIEKVTYNAHLIASVCERAVPIFQGTHHPLIGEPVISSKFHGETGMDGPTDLPDVTIRTQQLHAVEAMRKFILESKEPITLVALAPLTNLALLIRTYPDLLSNIEQITLMGGCLQRGNITPYAEFNVYVDPEAAEIVFTSGVPIVMSSLDVTETAILLPESFEHVRNQGRIGKFFCELMDFYQKGSPSFGAKGCMLHDVCAVIWLLRPELFSGVRGDVHVVLSGEQRGRTIFTPSPQGNILALNKIKVLETFGDLVIKAIEGLQEGRRKN